jgi:hypothetical protein
MCLLAVDMVLSEQLDILLTSASCAGLECAPTRCFSPTFWTVLPNVGSFLDGDLLADALVLTAGMDAISAFVSPTRLCLLSFGLFLPEFVNAPYGNGSRNYPG